MEIHKTIQHKDLETERENKNKTWRNLWHMIADSDALALILHVVIQQSTGIPRTSFYK